MTPFCASCISSAPDLVSVMLDERRVLMCGACREEHPRSGHWSFEGGQGGERYQQREKGRRAGVDHRGER